MQGILLEYAWLITLPDLLNKTKPFWPLKKFIAPRIKLLSMENVNVMIGALAYPQANALNVLLDHLNLVLSVVHV